MLSFPATETLLSESTDAPRVTSAPDNRPSFRSSLLPWNLTVLLCFQAEFSDSSCSSSGCSPGQVHTCLPSLVTVILTPVWFLSSFLSFQTQCREYAWWGTLAPHGDIQDLLLSSPHEGPWPECPACVPSLDPRHRAWSRSSLTLQVLRRACPGHRSGWEAVEVSPASRL